MLHNHVSSRLEHNVLGVELLNSQRNVERAWLGQSETGYAAWMNEWRIMRYSQSHKGYFLKC